MRLGEIIKTNHWLSVELTLLKIYPDQKESIEAYRKVYASLQEMNPIISKIEIVIEQEIDPELDKLGPGNVYGVDYESKDKFTKSVALEFTPWNKWLGMPINELSQREFTELEIIAHCLFEMTFVGYDEAEIKKEFSKIKAIVQKYKNGKKKSLKSPKKKK